jgi:hypothetical protein
MSAGGARIASGSGPGIELEAYPVPVFDNATVRTGEVGAVITLVPDGLVEMGGNTAARFGKDDLGYTVELSGGAIRFSVPPGVTLAITTPTAEVRVAAVRVPAGGAYTAGRVGVDVDGGKTYVESTRGSFEAGQGDDNTRVLLPGDAITLAGAQTASVKERGLLDGLTTVYQLEDLSEQEGVRVVLGEETPAAGIDEVCILIPAELGEGYIIGTPELIASGLNFSLITIGATPADVTEKEQDHCKTRVVGWWPAGGAAAIGAVLLIGTNAASGVAGIIKVASPSE